MECHYCDTSDDLRPYGPKGAMVCFTCAMKTPERKLETEQQFTTQLNACAGPAVIDGSNVGPYPAANHPKLRAAKEQGGE